MTDSLSETEHLNSPYYKKQILTYMGNKRKILPYIDAIIKNICVLENKDKLVIADGFSGSGIVSRLLKRYSSSLYVNDIAGYSKTINDCFLSNPSKNVKKNIAKYINNANRFVNNYMNENMNEKSDNTDIKKFIQGNWSPLNEEITIKDRVYFTFENGKRIDAYLHYIKHVCPKTYKVYLLAMLLLEVSKKNNTNGQFSAFYKNSNKIGHYGGEKEIDLNRITSRIILEMPNFDEESLLDKLYVSRMDTNEWIKMICGDGGLDVIYYDPPYNKHPYNIYYFLLDIVNNMDLDIEVPDTYRGQPKGWNKSLYNSKPKAKKVFTDLIQNTKSKYIIVSYNNKGIISNDDMRTILETKGKVEKIEFNHGTYNRLRGIANYKRKKVDDGVKEFIWLVECEN